MDTSEFDIKIKKFTTDVENKQDEIEKIVLAFIEATGYYASLFTKEKINEYVKDQPQVTKALSKEDLKKLKLDCRNLMNKLPEIADKELNKEGIWKHRTLMTAEEIYIDTHMFDSDVKKTLDEPIKRILSGSGKLIMGAGYTNKDKHNFPEWENGYPGFVYRSARYSPEMDELIKEYSKVYLEFNKAVYNLRKAKTEKEEAEAVDLWDQIE